MRISAGEVLAVLHEMAVSHFGTEYRFANQQNLLEKFATLSTSSAKYIGKKDRRTQKFSFRQLYNYIEVCYIFINQSNFFNQFYKFNQKSH